MLHLKITDETSTLKEVVLGRAESSGPVPAPEDAYDPKSLEHILKGTYPEEEDLIREMDGFADVFLRHGVTVYRPEVIRDCNQIFARDIAFVIDNKLIKANILPHREEEFEAILHVLDYIKPEHILYPPDEVHIEGGDVMPWHDHIFVGTYTGVDYPDYITARTNMEGVDYIRQMFPNKIVKSFELKKCIVNPKDNALHLDCCFQPVGKDKGIIHKEGFLIEEEYQWLVDFFGKENLFHITKDEMYHMNSNVFSISPEVVVSEAGFTRLNAWFRKQGIAVEEIPSSEVGKQGGLFRCSTLPLVRES